MSSIDNMYLNGSLGRLFARTAAPIILIMTINGLYVVADAYILGRYAGAEALSAVTLIFPAMMMLYALQTLVSNGMSSMLARAIGAGDRERARHLFTGAHLLSLGVVLVVYGLFALFGGWLIGIGASGAPSVAAGAELFMTITVACAPVAFFLSLNIDALRCEGRLGFMTLVTISATMLNIGFNWLFIGGFGWGVAGSAAGTVLAQAVCLIAVLIYRWRNPSALKYARAGRVANWRTMLALGAPTSLGLLGISLTSASLIANIRLWEPDHYVATIAAYGVVTRILTFAYLPLMGVSIAFQTICGNNFGARMMARTNGSLKIALMVVLIYCGFVQIVCLVFSSHFGAGFADDPVTVAEVARILPWTTAVYVLVGIPIILSGYFQALGDASRAGILGLTRTYLFAIPLVFILPQVMGEPGIWMAAPAADIAVIGLVAIVLAFKAARSGWKFGVLQPV